VTDGPCGTYSDLPYPFVHHAASADDRHCMSRANRFLAGITFGYLNQIVVLLGGLWLTPFLLHHLGQRDYGLWLVSLQVLTYLGLAEFGVVALLPRDVAALTGAGSEAEIASRVRALLEDSLGLICIQTVLVAAGAIAAWFWLPASWRPLRGPIGMILTAYVCFFPLRMFQATLEGLQRQAFLSSLATIAWALGLAVNVALVLNGFGVTGVAVGWICSQVVIVATTCAFLARNYWPLFPRRICWPRWNSVRAKLGRGSWMSLQQVAQILLNGTDLLVVGRMLGPAFVVPYSCTGKLNGIMSNQPSLLMQTAIPGLSQLRSGDSRTRTLSVLNALNLGMLTISGLCACLVISLNEFFVKIWVGPAQYAGGSLTLLLVLLMLVRHTNLTFAYTAFSFGYERQMCAVAILEGMLGFLLSLLLTHFWGMPGVVAGPLFAVCLTSLGSNARIVARDLGEPLYRVALSMWPWLWRFCAAASISAVAGKTVHPSSFPALFGTAGLVTAVYLIIVIPGMMKTALGDYLRLMATKTWNSVLQFSALHIRCRREIIERG
jgi:O-antigen/teichoic acid export membrane protein